MKFARLKDQPTAADRGQPFPHSPQSNQRTRGEGCRCAGLLQWEFILCAILIPHLGYSGGVLANCTEADFNAALANAGTVTFACDETIAVTGNKIIATNATLDASGHSITISGGNSVRPFLVNSNVSLTLLNLTIANGLSTNGAGVYVTNGGIFVATNRTVIGNSANGSNGV